MGATPMAEESEAPRTAGCARSGRKHAQCHCEHVSFLMGKYPKMGMDAIVHRLDRLDNAKDGLEEDVAGILDDQSAAERDMTELRAEQDRYRGNLELALEKEQRVVDSLLHLVEDMSGRLKRLEVPVFSDRLTACSTIRCPQCNCFAYDLTRLRLLARDFCESCHSGSLGRPGLEGSTILGKRKSKNCLQQRGVVCEKVATTLIGACTQVPPYHCIWSSQEHMAAGLEGSSILGKIKSKNSLQQRGVVCEIVATTLIGACTQVPPCHCIWSSQEHMAACMTLSEPCSSASFLTPMKPRMDPVLCCKGFEELLMWWPLDRQIILHFAEGYSRQ